MFKRLLILLLPFVFIITPIAANAASLSSGWYTIQPQKSAVLRLNIDDTKIGTQLKLKNAANKTGQKFYIQQQSDGTYKIGTGTTIGMSAITSGETQQKYVSSDKKQRWNINSNTDGSWQIVNASTNKALSYSSLTDGNLLSETTKSTADTQKFLIKPFDESYTVTFVDGLGKTLKRQSVKKGKAATAPANPTRTGYTFAGWYKALTNITANTTITAKWNIKTVKVVYNINIPNDTRTYTDTFTYNIANQRFGMRLTDKTGSFGNWKRTGYILLGWSENKNATEKQYPIYSGVSDNWINNNAGTKQLYAVWKKAEGTVVRFHPNGADNSTFVVAEMDVTTNNNLFSPRAIYWQRKGYVLIGYNTKPDGTGESFLIQNGKNIVSSSDFASNDVTLYAMWQKAVAEVDGTNEKVFLPNFGSMNAANMYVQGGDVFEKNGKKYVIGCWISTEASKEDHHIIAIFDYDTGKIVKQVNDIHIGHCNGIAYNPATDHFYVGSAKGTSCNATYNDSEVTMIELDYNLNIVKYHKLTKSWGGYTGAASAIDIYNGKYYVKHGQFIYEYTSDFVHTGYRTDGAYNTIKKTYPYIQSGIIGQGFAYNGKYFYTGSFSCKSFHDYITLIHPTTYAITWPIKYNTGDLENTNNLRELQDFSFDSKGNLYILSTCWRSDRGMAVAEVMMPAAYR